MPVIEIALTRLLGIEHPILLAPMGSAAGGKLAAAVTNAGGLGLVGSGYANANAIRKELAEAGNTRVGVGFILWALERNPSALDVALDAKPAAVMLSFGDPTPFTGRIKGAGCKIICQVHNWLRVSLGYQICRKVAAELDFRPLPSERVKSGFLEGRNVWKPP
jgi:nitronate monooxygenase